MFWPEGRANAPTFNQNTYDGSLLRSKCELFLSHLPPDAWPQKFAELVTEHTGILEPA